MTEFLSHHFVIAIVIITSDKNHQVCEGLTRNGIHVISKYLPLKIVINYK